MNTKLTSWRTTLAGIIAASGPILASVWPEHADAILKITSAVGGLGLIAARDNKVTSEQAGAKQQEPKQ